MLQPEIKQKWVEALESDNFHQCRGLLSNGIGEYCCLGVLMEIVHQNTTRGEDVMQKYFTLGLSLNDVNTFVNLNDVKKMSFAQIAEIIKEKY